MFSFCPKVSLRVRAGPGTNFNMLDGLAIGECYRVAGRNADSTWLYIGDGAWVIADFTMIDLIPPRILDLPIYGNIQATAKPPAVQPTARPTIQPTTRPVTGCPDGCINPPAGCAIKGNVAYGTGEKIYHLPGDKYYGVTTINPTYGERWFCTIFEAENNGFRRAER